MIFILTATVNVFLDVHPDFACSSRRRNEYIQNLTHLSSILLHYDHKIFFVENSSDLVDNLGFYPNLSNVEYIALNQSSTSVRGKGYCEIEMINHVLKIVGPCDFFIKITGRYSISNWHKILVNLRSINYCDHLIGTEDINFLSHQFSSRFFLISYSLWRSKFAQTFLAHVNDNFGYFIEHALFDLSRFSDPIVFDVLPSRIATSATTSSSLRMNPLVSRLKKFIYVLLKS